MCAHAGAPGLHGMLCHEVPRSRSPAELLGGIAAARSNGFRLSPAVAADCGLAARGRGCNHSGTVPPGPAAGAGQAGCLHAAEQQASDSAGPATQQNCKVPAVRSNRLHWKGASRSSMRAHGFKAGHIMPLWWSAAPVAPQQRVTQPCLAASRPHRVPHRRFEQPPERGRRKPAAGYSCQSGCMEVVWAGVRRDSWVGAVNGGHAIRRLRQRGRQGRTGPRCHVDAD